MAAVVKGLNILFKILKCLFRDRNLILHRVYNLTDGYREFVLRGMKFSYLVFIYVSYFYHYTRCFVYMEQTKHYNELVNKISRERGEGKCLNIIRLGSGGGMPSFFYILVLFQY